MSRQPITGRACWTGQELDASGDWIHHFSPAHLDDIDQALAAWEPEQLRIGRDLVRRTQRLGYSSQVANSWDAPTDDTIFRLREEGP